MNPAIIKAKTAKPLDRRARRTRQAIKESFAALAANRPLPDLTVKEVMERAGVPTAAYRSFTDEESCSAYVREVGGPIVVKADGLAAGKGVIVAKTTEEALEGVHECFSGAFGQAGATVVVEEMMEGPECSLLALTDGKTLVPLATSQDHKRALDGDLGPNTGGMGVYSPVPMVTPDELAQMIDVEKRVVAELAAEGITYSGCLYGGFMLTKDGPKVLEFNARFGDPETQVVLPRMKGDLVEAFLACDNGTFREIVLLYLRSMRRDPDLKAQLLMLCLEGWEAQPEKNAVYMQQMKLILQGCLRSGDPFTQIGAGQYWVLLPGAGSETHSAIAQRLQQAMHQRFAQSSAVFRTRAIDLRGMVHLAEPKD